MSLRIENFNIKSGIAKIEQKGREFTLNLYGYGESNCFLAAVWESKPDADGRKDYQLQWFFVDETHAKKMLGLQKMRDGSLENVFADELKGIVLYKKTCRDWYKLRTLFHKAFGKDFPVEIMEEEQAV